MPPPNRTFPGHKISITSAGFDPDRVEVKVDAVVTFANNDTVLHNVHFDPPLTISEDLEPGTSFDWKFAQPGEFQYHCRFHPHMTGTIKVT